MTGIGNGRSRSTNRISSMRKWSLFNLRLVSIWSQTITDRRSQKVLRSYGNILLRSWSQTIAEDRAKLQNTGPLLTMHQTDRTMFYLLRSSAIICDPAIIWKPKFCDLRSKNIPYYYMAKPVLGKSLCSDWFFLGQDFAVRTVSMETVQSVYFCFGAKPANSKFATKTAKKKCE